MVASVGGGYETVRKSLDARTYPMPGQLVDVGKHRLHLYCTGSGSPTVVLEPGFGGASSDFGLVAPAVARDRQCAHMTVPVGVERRRRRPAGRCADSRRPAHASLSSLLCKAVGFAHRWGLIRSG
jgi:hypothetical protein